MNFYRTLLATAGLVVAATTASAADPIFIGVGHQSMCTDTYTAGIVVKELGLLEKNLPKTGKYKDAKFEVKWADYSSGGPICPSSGRPLRRCVKATIATAYCFIPHPWP